MQSSRSHPTPIEPAARTQATIVHSQPLGMRSRPGHDLYALRLRISVPGQAPWELQVSDHVPVAAIPSLRPGATVPVKRAPRRGGHELAIDWQAALDEVDQ